MTSISQLFKTTVAVITISVALMGQALAVDIEHYKGTAVFDSTPKRVVVLGLGSLDILDRLGVKPVGAPHELLPPYLKKYEESTGNTGSVKEPDYEAIYTLKPDVIIAETRMLALYDDLNRIAPTVMMRPQDGQFWQDTQSNWRMLGKLFGKQAQVEKLITDIDGDIAQINRQVTSEHLNALMLMNNGGNIAMYNSDSRFSMVFEEFGFTESVSDSKERLSGPHGNLVSYEYIADAEPQVMFVLDRDQAVGNPSGKAKAQFDNALINKTPAAKNQKIVFVDPNAWYIASFGITGTEAIIADIRKALK